MFVEGKTDSIPGLKIEQTAAKSVRRQWKLRTREEQRLLKDVVPRFALRSEQIAKVLDDNRAKNWHHGKPRFRSREPIRVGGAI